MIPKKIVFGITGIGSGHVFSDLPLIETFIQRGHKVAVLGFDQSKRIIEKRFSEVKCVETKGDWIYENSRGIDFHKTAQEAIKCNINNAGYNYMAMSNIIDILEGEPDIILGDYECVSANLAYALCKPLITVDMHSKFLGNGFPILNNFTHLQEKHRIHLFYPKAEKRFCYSFCKLPNWYLNSFEVEIIPPLIRQEIINIKKRRCKLTKKGNKAIIYMSTYSTFPQDLAEVCQILSLIPNWEFYIFTSDIKIYNSIKYDNVHLYDIANSEFEKQLEEAEFIITTSGHTFISEAIHLGIPLYTIPLKTYEQHFNAYMVDYYQFGMNAKEISKEKIEQFITKISYYRENMLRRDDILLTPNNKSRVLQYLEDAHQI